MFFEPDSISPATLKIRSEKIILNAGGEILDWLPTLDITKPRTIKQVVNRALILNALYQLHLKAPRNYIADWIRNNSLASELTPKEIDLLSSPNELTNEDQYELYWSLESLWAIAWATRLIDKLPFDEYVGSELASLSPNLQLNENRFKYENNMNLRSTKELFEMLDLYYRLHWWTQSSKRMNKSTGIVDLNVIIWRRKALEWISDRDTSWENIDLSI